MENNAYQAKLIKKNKLTDDNYLLEYMMVDGSGFGFESRQFILIEGNFDGTDLKRAYSFSSLSNKLPIFDLTIKRIEDGKMSNRLIDMNIGEMIKFYGPYGDFVWSKGNNKRKVLIATGCGIAPLKSMLYYWLSNNLVDRIDLYYGNRFIDQAAYHENFLELASKNKLFNYFPCISKLEADKGIFCHGRVGDVIDKRNLYNNQNDYYMCGSAQMISEMKRKLLENNVDEKNIFVENIFV